MKEVVGRKDKNKYSPAPAPTCHDVTPVSAPVLTRCHPVHPSQVSRITVTAQHHPRSVVSMETIVRFEEMLFSVEERMLMLVEKPSTRVQACQLLAKSKGLRLEVEEFTLPDLEAEYSDEEGERLDIALEKYNDIRQSLAETQVRIMTILQGKSSRDIMLSGQGGDLVCLLGQAGR